MYSRLILSILLFLFTDLTFAQVPGNPEHFDYKIYLQEKEIEGFPTIHSFAFGTHGNDILIIGGRTDGLHARQPFAAFPLAYNNKQLIVVNPESEQVWTTNLSSFPVSIREQFQATNLNFYQIADTLYVTGGYAFSETANDHITFPYLTTIIISDLIESIKNGTSLVESVKQITDERFAVTGGQMGVFDNRLILVGGNKFVGRYNPMGNPTYTQTYTTQIQRFEINNSSTLPEVTYFDSVSDSEHLRRRDYNLVPYIFTDGRPGYLISAGVFQQEANLPFLYPVEIDDESYFPRQEFEQLLSHYHSPKLAFLDNNQLLHMIFFGGLAQYYYENGTLIEDQRVPFVDTISRVTRTTDGVFHEYVLNEKMPDLKGTNSEFIPNKTLPRNETGVFLIGEMEGSLKLGYIVGGIKTPERNPFTFNRTENTSGSSAIYEIILERTMDTNIPIEKPLVPTLNQNYPNPFNPYTTISYVLPEDTNIRLEVYNNLGQHVSTLVDAYRVAGFHQVNFNAEHLSSGLYIIRMQTNSFYDTKKMLLLK